MLNRFGRELYETFFQNYTEKVWGVKCTEISAEWGAQRIKGLSVTRALLHALKAPLDTLGLTRGGGTVNTSLIERFLYPKYGPGQMWETVAEQVRAAGGEIRLWQRAVGVKLDGNRLRAVTSQDVRTGERHELAANYVISTMPVSELIQALGDAVPAPVARVAAGLEYRDFITVGLAGKELAIHGADYDLRLLRRVVDAGAARVFDTMIDARLLGLPDFSLASLILKYFGVPPAKASQKSNWSRRPMRPQLTD